MILTTHYLLRFDAYNESPFEVQETLLVLPDGALSYLSAAPVDAQRRNRAGSFSARLTDEGLTSAQALAQELRDLREDPAPQRGAITFCVTVLDGETPRTFNLISAQPLPAVLVQATQAYNGWQALAEQSPTAVVQMAVRYEPGADKIRLVYAFSNPGSQKVAFLLDPAGFSCAQQVGSGLRPVWTNQQQPAAGLIDQTGKFLDGFNAPARLAPGSRASLIFRLPAAAIDSGPGFAYAAGRIALAPPGAEPPRLPDAPIRLYTPVNF